MLPDPLDKLVMARQFRTILFLGRFSLLAELLPDLRSLNTKVANNRDLHEQAGL